MVKELDLISKIKKSTPRSSEDLICGIGDDCAVFGRDDQGSWLITTDMLVDSVHFDRSWHDAHGLGRKSMAVNLSDVAAMGGIPKFVLLSVCISSEVTDKWLDSWFKGVQEILKEYDCVLIGGDTVSGKELTFSVTVLGKPTHGGPIYRHSAKIGDGVYVSGFLGNAAAGLALCKAMKESNVEVDQERYALLMEAHLNPMPQVGLGRLLAESDCITAMQDISDGLATDLGHITKESGVGAKIFEALLPIAPEVEALCDSLGYDKHELALSGGEDYQLVFTVNNKDEDRLMQLSRNWPYTITRIGTITRDRGVVFEDAGGTMSEISFTGYEHG